MLHREASGRAGPIRRGAIVTPTVGIAVVRNTALGIDAMRRPGPCPRSWPAEMDMGETGAGPRHFLQKMEGAAAKEGEPLKPRRFPYRHATAPGSGFPGAGRVRCQVQLATQQSPASNESLIPQLSSQPIYCPIGKIPSDWGRIPRESETCRVSTGGSDTISSPQRAASQKRVALGSYRQMRAPRSDFLKIIFLNAATASSLCGVKQRHINRKYMIDNML